jgi:hypothetical protein
VSQVRAKPLASPVFEYRLMGWSKLFGGVALGVFAVTVDEPAAAVAGWLVGAVWFGAWMYVVVRRSLRRSVGHVAPLRMSEREPVWLTLRRIALGESVALAILAAIALGLGAPYLVGGLSAGHGAALLLTSRWLRKWQEDHGGRLMGEPGWRWSGKRGGARSQRHTVTVSRTLYLVPDTDAPA